MLGQSLVCATLALVLAHSAGVLGAPKPTPDLYSDINASVNCSACIDAKQKANPGLSYHDGWVVCAIKANNCVCGTPPGVKKDPQCG